MRWFVVSRARVRPHSVRNASKNVPLPTLDTWMWWNENGWKDLEKGQYDRAGAESFKMAIKAIEPYAPANRKLMRADVPRPGRGCFITRSRYADAEPLAVWGAQGTRRRQEGDVPIRFFSACSPSRRSRPRKEHFADAEPNWKQSALALQEKELSGSHVNTLLTLDRLALVLRSQRKYQEAEPLYLRAIAIHERTAPDENLDLADTIDQYVILVRRMSRKSEAEIWEDAAPLAIRDTASTKAARAKLDRGRDKTDRGFK